MHNARRRSGVASLLGTKMAAAVQALTTKLALGRSTSPAVSLGMVFGAALFLSACEGMAPTERPQTSAPTAPVAVVPSGDQPSVANVPPGGRSGEAKVALLLPFKHPEKNIRSAAEALQRAAEMAIFDSHTAKVTLLPRDTGSTPESAAAAAQDALAQGAELILGPLRAPEVQAIAPIAAARGVPVIAFSNDRSVAGNGVFLLSFLPEEEVRRVVAQAAGEGRKRFAALIPDDPYGVRVEAAFQAEVVARGAQIVALERYRPDPQALDGAVKKIRRAPFDALFLADGGAMLRSLAPILAVNGVDARKVRFMGTRRWDDQAVIAEVSLTGGWYVVPPPEQRRAFLTRYEQTYGTKAPGLASLAYDGVALATVLSGGQPGQRYTVQTITDPNGFAGIDGIFRFLPNGLTERGLAVMEIAGGGQVKVVAPAPASFQKAVY